MTTGMLHVKDTLLGEKRLVPEEMAADAGETFALDIAKPRLNGRAFPLRKWYLNWSGLDLEAEDGRLPTHLLAEAADEFQACIPRSEMKGAAVLYAPSESSDAPQGFKVRLYVPHGSSDCLNIKDLIALSFVRDPSLPGTAEFGFKNEVPLHQLSRKLSSRKG